ncbi:MAG TPA: hypothetical protein VG496_15280, partial [Myxococcales bacterium]|nr:hypothetical protein [Myxococcales bacterium]
MERRNSPYRLALLAVVAATASACDGQGFKQASSKSNQQLAECSISIPANSTAMHLHQTVNKVLSAKLDACGGAIDVAGTSREFIGMEADESSVHLLFRIVPN